MHAEIRESIEAMDLLPGYEMTWGGEFENAAEANESLAGQLPVSLIIMVLISILLFSALRQPIIIWFLVPMSVNGVVLGLLGTGLPFTFTALLGLLSLSGMLIKNGIVLIEEIDIVRREGLVLPDAIVKACISRLRPVILAAATTILGMLPLLTDAFFRVDGGHDHGRPRLRLDPDPHCRTGLLLRFLRLIGTRASHRRGGAGLMYSSRHFKWPDLWESSRQMSRFDSVRRCRASSSLSGA